MKKRLFLYTVLIVFTGLLSFFAVSVYITYTDNFKIAKDNVMEITQICANIYSDIADEQDIQFLMQVENNNRTRITIISSDGIVLADSRPLDVNSIENHLNRPEIQAAASDSPTPYVRYSDTLGIDLVYYALKVNNINISDSYVFVRAAVPTAGINVYLLRSLPMLIFILVIVALLCFVFIRSVINRITKPFNAVEQKLRLLSSGEYVSESIEPIAESYEEIDKITHKIDEIALILQNSFDSLRSEKNKLNYILNNISDGIFAVDENKNIALINLSALNIFDVTPDISDKNLNYLSYEKTLVEAVEDCVNSANDAIFELALKGKIFLVTVKQLTDTKLTMAVLSDITETRENTKRREEFFANASHELKTPLTAIKGFNELTAINNKDEKINKYIDSITRETDRMLTLIGDMLKLSELENMQVVNSVPVQLANVVNEVCEDLSIVIKEKSVNFSIVGDAVVYTEPQHIYELIKNIIENAVRYNNQGGRVSVTIESDKNSVWLFVFDNGIGISPEEQTRIFERFYRVEKSRSQRNGGTGLGLSIVKHICALYDWKLSLKSKLGVGTEITVLFEK